jgi:hypothetical protein
MDFSITESLKFGWHKTKAQSGLLFKALLVIFTLQVCYAVVNHVLDGEVIGVLAALAISIAQFVTGVGFTLITLRIAQGKHTELSDIIPPLEVLWRYFAATALVGLIVLAVMVGFVGIALIVAAALGGIHSDLFPIYFAFGAAAGVVAIGYLSLRFSMVRYAVLDGSGITESLHCSTEITRNHLWHLLGFLLVILFINLLGVVVFFVGLLVSIPVTPHACR